MSRVKWDLEKIKQAAAKYNKKVDFQKKDNSAYTAAKRRGILEEVCAHMKRKNYKKYTDQELIDIALCFNTRTEFQRKNKQAYVQCHARGSGFMEKACLHMYSVKKVQKHTKESAAIDAIKYKTKREFCVNDAGSYLAAVKNGWIDEICAHMEVKRKKTPSVEEIAESAKKYNSRGEWDRKDPRTYNAARKLKRVDDFCHHMNGGGRSGPETEILNLIKTVFPSANSKTFKNTDTKKFPLKRYEIDVYIPEIKKGIEFDGKYWHSFEALKKRKNLTEDQARTYHEDKDAFFKSIGIDIFHIKEEDWYENKKQIKNEVTEFLNLFFGNSMVRTSHYRRQTEEYKQELKEIESYIKNKKEDSLNV